jgi:hypothetical protein
LNPLQPATFDQAREMLKQPKCVGIKIHPEEHVYPITEHGLAIFKLAAELRTVILTQSGSCLAPTRRSVFRPPNVPESTMRTWMTHKSG